MNIVRLSENTIVILFEQIISHDNFVLISQLVSAIKQHLNEYIVDIIPSYASIHIAFNLLKISGLDFKKKINELTREYATANSNSQLGKVIEIPVYYGEEVALDLSIIAEKSHLSEQGVIDAHSKKTYDVYAIGFAPGFAYLGNVDESISFPRKETPRKKVSQGSLGIADKQTAVYPSESPGGWQIIGRTPIQLIDYNSKNLTYFNAGDKVKFVPVDRLEYIRLGGVL